MKALILIAIFLLFPLIGELDLHIENRWLLLICLTLGILVTIYCVFAGHNSNPGYWL
jgi:hypothetical protein